MLPHRPPFRNITLNYIPAIIDAWDCLTWCLLRQYNSLYFKSFHKWSILRSCGVMEVHNIIGTWFLEIQMTILLLGKLSVYPFPIFSCSGFSGSIWCQPYICWKILQVNDLFLYKVLNLHVVTSTGILYIVFLSLLLCLESSPLLNFVNYWLLVLLLNLCSILTHTV